MIYKRYWLHEALNIHHIHYIKHQGFVLNKDIAVSGLSWGYQKKNRRELGQNGTWRTWHKSAYPYPGSSLAHGDKMR